MPHRHYDLDEVLALAESGMSAVEIIEDLGLSVGERAIQKTVRKFIGPRPQRPQAVVRDKLRRRIVALMIARGLNERFCNICDKYSPFPCSIREMKADDNLESLCFVCRHCRRAGDV